MVEVRCAAPDCEGGFGGEGERGFEGGYEAGGVGEGDYGRGGPGVLAEVRHGEEALGRIVEGWVRGAGVGESGGEGVIFVVQCEDCVG